MVPASPKAGSEGSRFGYPVGKTMKLETVKTAESSADTAIDDAAEVRRFIRRNINAKGWIRHARRRHPVRLENLSEQGCQLWLPLRAGLAKGATITLFIETMGPFEATVRWYRDGWTGVEFDLPVYVPILEHIHDTFDRDAAPADER